MRFVREPSVNSYAAATPTGGESFRTNARESGDLSDRDDARRFYDHTYYDATRTAAALVPTTHLRRLALRTGIAPGQRLLDVACGTGEWLQAVADAGAIPVGLDISWRALHACKARAPGHDLCVGDALELPFPSATFDLVSCLGALEHFAEPMTAIAEMLRVSRPRATFLFLLPNADFLPRALGLFRGTEQAELRETPRSISAWKALLRAGGLETLELWRDLHIVSWRWIAGRRPRGRLPVRLLAAALLLVLPLRWQYQAYFLCRRFQDLDSPPTAGR